jgi:hypothetical protein
LNSPQLIPYEFVGLDCRLRFCLERHFQGIQASLLLKEVQRIKLLDRSVNISRKFAEMMLGKSLVGRVSRGSLEIGSSRDCPKKFMLQNTFLRFGESVKPHFVIVSPR